MNKVYVKDTTLGGPATEWIAYDPPEGITTCNTLIKTTGAANLSIARLCMKLVDSNAMNNVIKAGGSIGVYFECVDDAGVIVRFGGIPQNAGCNMIPSLTITFDNTPDFCEVIFVDRRGYGHSNEFEPYTKAWNVQEPDFRHYYESTRNGVGVDWTWAEVFNTLGIDVTYATLPAWVPRNLSFDGVPWVLVMDAVVSRLFLLISYEDASDTYCAFDCFTEHPRNILLWAQLEASDYELDSRTSYRKSVRRPEEVHVYFRAADEDNKADPFNGMRNYTRVVMSGGDGPKLTLQMADYIGIYSAAAWVNSAELDTVGDDLGNRAAFFISSDAASVYRLAGVWDFIPDGLWRQIIWRSDRNGATTTLSTGITREYQLFKEDIADFGLACNVGISGMSNINVLASPSGERRVWQYPFVDEAFGVGACVVWGTGGAASTNTATTTDTWPPFGFPGFPQTPLHPCVILIQLSKPVYLSLANGLVYIPQVIEATLTAANLGIGANWWSYEWQTFLYTAAFDHAVGITWADFIANSISWRNADILRYDDNSAVGGVVTSKLSTNTGGQTPVQGAGAAGKAYGVAIGPSSWDGNFVLATLASVVYTVDELNTYVRELG